MENAYAVIVGTKSFCLLPPTDAAYVPRQLIRQGKVITLCDDNHPLAEIRPLPRPSTSRRPFGLGRGTFTVPEDFGKVDPEIEQMFYGGPA